MDGLRIPKLRVPAKVGQIDGTVRLVEVFLAPNAETHDGPERPSDAFGRERGFIPAIDMNDGELVCLNVETVTFVRVPAEVEPPGAEGLTLPTEHEVQIVLTGGTQLSGFVTYVRPPGSARLSDFLNEPPRLLRVLQGSEVFLVNKNHIVRVVARGS